jgi:hypothetical protein
MANTAPSRLLDLPLELRFHIYSYLLRSNSGTVASTETLRHIPMPNLRVLQTCKQIHVEGQQYFFEHNTCFSEINAFTRLTEIKQLEATIAKFRRTELSLHIDCNCALAWLVLSKMTAALRSAQESNTLPLTISISIDFSVRLNCLQGRAIADSRLGFLSSRQKFKDAARGVPTGPLRRGPHGFRRHLKAVLQLPAWEAELHAVFVKTQLQHCMKQMRELAELNRSIILTTDLKDEVNSNMEIKWISRTVVSFRDEEHKRRGSIIVKPAARGSPVWNGHMRDAIDDIDVRLLRWRELA